MFRRSAAVLTLALAAAGCASLPPRPADLTQLSLSDAATLVRARQVTSVELTQAYITRADANLGLNVYVTLDRAGALAAAQRADADLDTVERLGRLHGVPLVVKDNTHVAGLPNTAGTPALRGFVPKENAPTVQKLVDAGAVILGKTNMHELAFGISGYNEAFFTSQPIGTRNPYDRTRFAGGSSSGTGAAIGARLAPGGLGSDTGGSVRIPAAVSGGAGLRPTIGRYSQDGVTPISHSRDTVGPMGQTVADVALLDAVITGGRPPAPAPLSGVRLGVNRAYFFKDLDVDTRAVTETVFESAPLYAAAMREARPALLKIFTDAFQRYGIDALIGPTTPAVAATQGPDASSLPTFLLFIRNTDPGSNAGIPGLTIPAGLGSSSGLPVGISLDGPRGSDQRLLAIGIAIERVLGRTPPPGR